MLGKLDAFLANFIEGRCLEELPSKNFVRIHRSYTIAIDKIDTIQGNTVKIDGAKYVIGRTYSDAFKERIAKHMNTTN